MKSTKYASHNEFSWEPPYFEKIPGLNAPALDSKLLK